MPQTVSSPEEEEASAESISVATSRDVLTLTSPMSPPTANTSQSLSPLIQFVDDHERLPLAALKGYENAYGFVTAALNQPLDGLSTFIWSLVFEERVLLFAPFSK
ncbi:unnamed protein product [Mucor fragilis]|jgi:hypothetical protein